MYIQGFALAPQMLRSSAASLPVASQPDNGSITPSDMISVSSRASALSTNDGVNRILSDILGPRASTSGNAGSAAFNFAQGQSPAAASSPAADLAASRTPVQNLMAFGGDRKTAVGTLIASGAKAENPDLGFFKDAMRKIVGGTKTTSKKISASQKISTKVKVKNFNLKALRLTTKGAPVGNEQTVRHVDFAPTAPQNGKTAQVKDIGTVIAKGTPTRMIEQDIRQATPGQQAQVTNSYFDPKSGQRFMETTERANRIETDKMGLTKSHKDKATYRQIEMLGTDGKADQRYVFDYGAKSVRLESLGDDGQVTSSQKLSKKTDYFGLVDRLSMNPPSAAASSAAAGVGAVAGGGGGGRLDNAHVNMV